MYHKFNTYLKFYADNKIRISDLKKKVFLPKITTMHNLSKNVLIKIDCQGAELPILKGATSLFHKTDFILLEIPFFGQYNEGVPSFLEHIQYMDSIGFVSYDIIDNHYINDFNMQVDVLFINKNHKFNSTVNELL